MAKTNGIFIPACLIGAFIWLAGLTGRGILSYGKMQQTIDTHSEDISAVKQTPVKIEGLEKDVEHIKKDLAEFKKDSKDDNRELNAKLDRILYKMENGQ